MWDEVLGYSSASSSAILRSRTAFEVEELRLQSDAVEALLDLVEALLDALQARDEPWYSVSSRSKRWSIASK